MVFLVINVGLSLLYIYLKFQFMKGSFENIFFNFKLHESGLIWFL